MQLVYIMISITVYIQMSIIKLLCLSKTSIILKIFNYFCRYKFKNRSRNFQPENGEKFKNKPGCPNIVVLIKIKSVWKEMRKLWQLEWRLKDLDKKKTHLKWQSRAQAKMKGEKLKVARRYIATPDLFVIAVANL